MFSINQNSSIERMENGDVVISFRMQRGTGSIGFSSDDWCSMITAVAAEPDSAETHQKVVEVHEGK